MAQLVLPRQPLNRCCSGTYRQIRSSQASNKGRSAVSWPVEAQGEMQKIAGAYGATGNSRQPGVRNSQG
jgi:hypothetical protein